MEQLQVGTAQAHYNAAGNRILKYSVEMTHLGLGEHRIVTAPQIDILQHKANLLAQKWAEKWAEREVARVAKEQIESSLQEAQNLTDLAERAQREIESILVHTLKVDDRIDWDSLKKNSTFWEPPPDAPTEPTPRSHPSKPDRYAADYTPHLSLLDKLISSRKERKLREAEERFSSDVSSWEAESRRIDGENEQLRSAYEAAVAEFKLALEGWEVRRANFNDEQAAFNHRIDGFAETYRSRSPEAVVEYCELVLNASVYPEWFVRGFELEYNPESQILIVEFELPSVDHFPKIKEVKFVASRRELKAFYYPDSHIERVFDETMYKVALRTLHELYEADVANTISAISFNGWVRAINRASGQEENNCILTIQVSREEFQRIDLAHVDPKACFRGLKGVASSKLSSLTPVQPILRIDTTDKRFIDGYAVVGDIDSSTNLAAMDWEDFEHLIRELFEKEFISGGGEVRVTQASKDGGVDAVAFDPDPIRGGKIVIQAKRYTNTVGVSAVRDLYGTVVNEGATKGILVTTADFGPDAYGFAKGKPLTLLNGSNLLFLLEKHGHHARIDLREAKRLQAGM